MASRNSDSVYSLLVTVAIFILMMIVYTGLGAVSCKGKTSGIGYPARYLILGGCQIQVDERWLPLDNYREFGR